MDRGLIIRATSVQHLPLVAKKITELYPHAVLDILTHQNAIHSLGRPFNRDNIIVYGCRGCFSLRGMLKGGVWKKLLRKKYTFVVVPVENHHGSGYENVFKVALSTLPRNVIVVNKQGEITTKSLTNCFCMLLIHAFLFPLSLLLSIMFSFYFMGKLTFSLFKRVLRT